MNSYCELSSNKFILLQLVIHIHLTLSQNTSQFNVTNPQSTTNNSNITWIKITTINPTPSTTSPLNYSNTENASNEDANPDFPSSSRRKRRKRRRNKYRTWNQRRAPEHSHKKHSTRVHLDKPVQFLIPSDYQENLIPNESEFVKPRYENDVNSGTKQTKEKSPNPPARYLLPPFVDQYFLGNSVTADTEKKPSKTVEWSANANRGATKFKHTIYYSDSGNEILSYEIKSTTPAAIQTTARTEPSRRPEYRPIVVQPMPIQSYTNTQAFVNNSNYATSNAREKLVNNFVSSEVANAGMQVINMSAYQQSQLPQQKQFFPVQKYKQYVEPPTTQPMPTPTPPRINQPQFQQIQQIQPSIVNSQIVYKNIQNEDRRQAPETQTFNQQYREPNYYHSTSYTALLSDPRSTTPVTQFTTTNRTTIIARTESTTTNNFKGLEIAESKYFSDIPSEQEFSALQNDQVIPGVAGKDYPVFAQTLLQKRRFACRGLEGYFADITSRCQVFYICNGDGAGEPMLCPNGTLFSQELLVCDWWYNVDC